MGPGSLDRPRASIVACAKRHGLAATPTSATEIVPIDPEAHSKTEEDSDSQ